MTDRELMQQALAALDWAADYIEPRKPHNCDCPVCVASDALRERLAQPEQEPVAWMQEMPIKGDETRSVRLTTVEALARREWTNPIPLYATPPRPREQPQRTHWEGCDEVHPECRKPRREWVGLEQSDMPDGEDPIYDDPRFIAGMVWAANKLKEKNA